MERTLVLIKPDAVQRGLTGEIITRFEKRGLKIVAAKFLHVSTKLAEVHYAIHKGKPFYEGLIHYISSSPIMALVLEGEDAVASVRQTMGSTNPLEAAPGTIRHDLSLRVSRNLTHGSDSLDNATKEISLWFESDEIVNWTKIDDTWIFGNN